MGDAILLVNPMAGGGVPRRVMRRLEAAAREREVELVVTGSGEEVVATARRAAGDGAADRLVVVGGDGTLHLAVQGLAGSGCALGIVPRGRGNDLAGSLGVPRRLDEALRVAFEAPVRRIDLGRVEGVPARPGGEGAVGLDGPGAAGPEGARPEGAGSEGAGPKGAGPGAGVAGAAAPGAAVQGAAAAGAAAPGAAAAGAGASGAAAPGTAVPGAAVPGAERSAWFAVYCGVGFDGEVARRANAEGRRLPGVVGYVYAVLATLAGYRAPRFEVEHDEGAFEGTGMFVTAANCPRFGGGMRIAPAAEVDDGVLDLVVVRGVPRRTLLAVFPKVYAGRHVGHPAVSFARTATARVRLDVPLTLFADGEPLWAVGEGGVAIEVVPGALGVASPR